IPHEKTGTAPLPQDSHVIPQKQPGLCAVVWHPLGGQPKVEEFCALADAVHAMPEVELRLAPDESVYIINLNGEEAARVLGLLEGSNARSLFETSVSCIGAATCQVGVRDSQALLAACVAAVREAGLPDGALPQIHISGCPSSCGTHQTGAIGFRGAAKVIDRQPHAAFTLYVNGCSVQGCEAMGRELGVVLEERIPAFLVALGHTVAESGRSYAAWSAADPEAIDRVAAPYLA
ncbi:MAG: nitrite/sulfite reductase, partial [Gemmiger sp.]